MPIRIKPEHRLKPGLLNLDSLQGITQLVSRKFDIATFSATDGIWEIYDEDGQEFIKKVSNREKLDSFLAKAKTSEGNGLDKAKKIEIVFDAYQTSVNLTADPKYQSWFEDFIIDLEKFILKPSFNQRITWVLFVMASPLSFQPYNRININPHCKIIITKKQKNTLFGSGTASLIPKFISMIVSAGAVLITQWILNTYGMDIGFFFAIFIWVLVIIAALVLFFLVCSRMGSVEAQGKKSEISTEKELG